VAEKGVAPQKTRAEKQHHPLLAALGEAQCVLNAWLRGGAESPSRGGLW
jgi:hypothetical protein